MKFKTFWGNGDADRGRCLREARESKGMSREQASKVLDLPVIRLWMLETGEMRMEVPEMYDQAVRIIQGAKP
jgi:hypothetical protein